jgi:hypothetical protein
MFCVLIELRACARHFPVATGCHGWRFLGMASLVSAFFPLSKYLQIAFSPDLICNRQFFRKRVVDTVLTRRAVSCGGVMVSAT